MIMNTQNKEELKSILLQKKELLGKMLNMTIQIKAELQQDNIEAFAEAIKNRQMIIAGIDELTKAEHALGTEDDIEILALKKEIRDIVAQTLQQDEENTTLAHDNLQLYKDQIKHLNQTKKGVGHYANQAEGQDAFFVDANK